MSRDPLTKQRSAWVEDTTTALKLDETMGGALEPDLRLFRRNVHDGQLRAMTGTMPGIGFHLSISHIRPSGQPGRYPTWDEIAHARYELCPPDITMAMLLPPEAEYVAVHPTTFHLHQIEDPRG